MVANWYTFSSKWYTFSSKWYTFSLLASLPRLPPAWRRRTTTSFRRGRTLRRGERTPSRTRPRPRPTPMRHARTGALEVPSLRRTSTPASLKAAREVGIPTLLQPHHTPYHCTDYGHPPQPSAGACGQKVRVVWGGGRGAGRGGCARIFDAVGDLIAGR